MDVNYVKVCQFVSMDIIYLALKVPVHAKSTF